MSRQKLRYLGNGPGQGDGVRIGGTEYKRNETYEVDYHLAAVLLGKGGFEVVKSIRKRIPKKVIKEYKS